MTREEMKTEALARMAMLGIFPQTIAQFKNEGKVSISEPPMGAFYWADDADLDRIRLFEEKNEALVCVVIRTYTAFGKMDCYLYVSKYQEEWEQDRTDIVNMDGDNGLLAYVFNCDMPDCSEFGYIGVARTPAAGLRRTW